MKKIFDMFDFDAMYEFIWAQPTSKFSARVMRATLFDYYRSSENYEAIYEMVKFYGGEIE